MKHLISLYALHGINVLYPLMVLPLLSGSLSTSGLGVLLYHQAIAQMGMAIVEYGFNLSAAREIAQSNDNEKNVKIIFWKTTLAKSFLAAVVMCIGIILSLSSTIDLNLLFAFFGMILGSVLFPVWYFHGRESITAIVISHGASKLIGLALIYIFVNAEKDLYLAATIMGGIYFISGLICIPKLIADGLFKVKNLTIKTKDVLCYINETKNLALSNISAGFYSNAGLAIMGMTSGVSTAALASIGLGVKIRNSMPALSQPFDQLVFVRSSKFYKSASSLPKWTYSLFVIQLLVFGIISCFIASHSSGISQLFLRVADDHYIIFGFILSGYLSIARRSFFIQLLASRSEDKIVASASVGLVVIMLSTTALTSFIFGADAWNLIISYMVAEILMLLYGLRFTMK